MTTYVIAREQFFIRDNGTQYTDGFDECSVVGRGRSLKAAVRRAGGWQAMPGYYVFDDKTGQLLGKAVTNEFGCWDIMPA